MSRQTGIPQTPLRDLLKSSTVTLAVFVAGIILTLAACTKDVPSESDQVVKPFQSVWEAGTAVLVDSVISASAPSPGTSSSGESL
ncbi:UNVERIFIED_CONTAM: hypothetical protein DES50_107173 [Williamsia faeni]